MGRLDYETETLMPVSGGFFDQTSHGLKADGFDASEDGTGRGTPIIPILEVGKRCGTCDSARDGLGIGDDGDPMFTLQSGAQHGVCAPVAFGWNKSSSQTMAVGDTTDALQASESSNPAIAFAQNQRDEVRMMKTVGALAGEPGMKQQTYLMVENDTQFQMRQLRREDDGKSGPCQDSEGAAVNDRLCEVSPFTFETRIARNGRGNPSELCPALKAHEAGIHADSQPMVSTRYGVRRLTPTECERLQGFPDGYTAIAYKGKPAADGPRYKALGNSMCRKVMHWLGTRIDRGREVLRVASATPLARRIGGGE